MNNFFLQILFSRHFLLSCRIYYLDGFLNVQKIVVIIKQILKFGGLNVRINCFVALFIFFVALVILVVLITKQDCSYQGMTLNVPSAS